MNSEKLSDYIVEHFNALANQIIKCRAKKPDTTGDAVAERDDFQIFVLPFIESETRINRGDVCDERRTVSVVVNGPIPPDGNITRAKALDFVEQLKRSLRLTKWEGYRWRNNEGVTLWNPEAVSKGQFCSVFRAEYIGLS